MKKNYGNRIEKELDYLIKYGFPFNPILLKVIKNDKIVSFDDNGNKTTYLNLEQAIDVLGKKSVDKINLKWRIKEALLSQDNRKVLGLHWDIRQQDYDKRS